MDDAGGSDQSDATYCLTCGERRLQVFARHPKCYSLHDIPNLYQDLQEYWNRILEPNLDTVDHVLIEEYSLLPALQGDPGAIIAYLTPLFDGDIIPGTMGGVVTYSGWLITALDYVDPDGEEVTALYMTELPLALKLPFLGRQYTNVFNFNVH